MGTTCSPHDAVAANPDKIGALSEKYLAPHFLPLSDELHAAKKIQRLMLKLFPHNTFTHMWKMLCGNTVNPQLSSTNAICC